MARKYTAQEMREQAEYEESVEGSVGTIEMLRQAADMMEREEMYECKGAIMKKGVAIWCSSTYDNVTDARGDAEQYGPNGKVVVLRRTVSEWEEVK